MHRPLLSLQLSRRYHRQCTTRSWILIVPNCGDHPSAKIPQVTPPPAWWGFKRCSSWVNACIVFMIEIIIQIPIPKIYHIRQCYTCLLREKMQPKSDNLWAWWLIRIYIQVRESDNNICWFSVLACAITIWFAPTHQRSSNTNRYHLGISRTLEYVSRRKGPQNHSICTWYVICIFLR